ncbi:unnamed protein product [Parnassius apollo]|uniref:(apollo) hypothetical protein n=1 Tax=Parnassius apollo TaxID=110799 RepID=A0A8S3WM67_PARAO|nr:unnamed protein product [Parnassius apollo]
MSDSSEEEDLSRFQEAVDTTFVKLINAEAIDKVSIPKKSDSKLCSQRYLDEATHYNDVKVSKDLQKKIGAKVSEIINRNLKFVNVQDNEIKKPTIEGGVKLFRDSDGFLSCEDAKDTFTENHNNFSRKFKRKRRQMEGNLEEVDEHIKIKSVVVSGEYVLSKEEIKCWKSRRKEKLFKYKAKGDKNVLTALE